MWSVGERIQDRWEIHRILHGGMGSVYVVFDHEWREALAAKTLREDLLAGDPALARLFVQEATTWVDLDVHPHVTEARMVHQVEGRPLLFLEYVSGGDLSAWIGTSRLLDDLPRVLSLSLQFCDGMCHLASRGVEVHRDVKPQNCLVTEEGVLKITDFGLARVLQRGPGGEPGGSRSEVAWLGGGVAGSSPARDDVVARTGMVAGTPTHMAPEQFFDAKHVDVRADVYAFGVLLFEMLAGHLPFLGESWQALRSAHVAEPPPPLRGHPPDLCRLVETCLAKDPEARLRSFLEVRRELAIVYRQVTGEAAPEPVVGVALSAARCNNKAASLAQLGRHRDALLAYDRSLELDGLSPLAWSNRGVVLGKGMGRWEEALESCDRALGIDADCSQAWTNRSLALRALGRPQEAVESCERALACDRRNAEAWSNKGVALHALRRPVEALACLDEAARLAPRVAATWSNRGVVLGEGLGRWQEALLCHERATDLDPAQGACWVNRGNALLALGRPGEALQGYDRAAELSPGDARLWSNRGAALRVLGRREEALASQRRALELDPSYLKGWINMGNVLQELDRPADALACYGRVLEVDERQAGAWVNRAVALLALERTEEAMDSLERARLLGHPHAERLIAAYRAGG